MSDEVTIREYQVISGIHCETVSYRKNGKANREYYNPGDKCQSTRKLDEIWPGKFRLIREVTKESEQEEEQTETKPKRVVRRKTRKKQS